MIRYSATNWFALFAVPGVFVVSTILFILAAGLDSSNVRASEKEKVPGIVSEQPNEGPFVETELGFMVPYEVTIPGTDVTFAMMPCPGGKFLIGSPEEEAGRKDNEGPQVKIVMEPFWLGKTEVTWKEYEAYMAINAVFKAFHQFKMREITEDKEIDAITAPSFLDDPSFTLEAGGGADQPAVTMTQYAAKQYTKWLSGLTGAFYRLPTEAEWEYACRAGSNFAFSFGDDPKKLSEYAWYVENSDGKRHDVAQKKPNRWGLYDMHGSVAEWVLDELSEDGYASWEGGMLTDETAVNWPKRVYPRVVRGGSWEMPAAACRSAARLGSDDKAWKDEDPSIPASPWWYTTSPATGVGMRVFRPLQVPASAEEKERYWKADHEQIAGDVDVRLNNEGRGAKGFVDMELPAAIEELKELQNSRKRKVR